MKYTKTCDECGSPFFEGTSQMQSLCPECAHRLYSYPECRHEFENGRCTLCGWNGRVSPYLSKGDSHADNRTDTRNVTGMETPA